MTGRRPLGRKVEHDPRSRAYAIDHLVAKTPVRSVEWHRYSPILDQGSLGSCTGNAMVGWMGCAPSLNATPADTALLNEDLAVMLYGRATVLDEFDGQWPPDDTGSSGLGVCKAAKEAGFITRYQHGFSEKTLLKALMRGPVIVGTPWFEGFDEPDQDGKVYPTGEVRGGHEFLIRGVVKSWFNSRTWLICDNSWGPEWGVNGSFMFSGATWNKLRVQHSDVTIPIR